MVNPRNEATSGTVSSTAKRGRASKDESSAGTLKPPVPSMGHTGGERGKPSIELSNIGTGLESRSVRFEEEEDVDSLPRPASSRTNITVQNLIDPDDPGAYVDSSLFEMIEKRDDRGSGFGVMDSVPDETIKSFLTPAPAVDANDADESTIEPDGLAPTRRPVYKNFKDVATAVTTARALFRRNDSVQSRLTKFTDAMDEMHSPDMLGGSDFGFMAFEASGSAVVFQDNAATLLRRNPSKAVGIGSETPAPRIKSTWTLLRASLPPVPSSDNDSEEKRTGDTKADEELGKPANGGGGGGGGVDKKPLRQSSRANRGKIRFAEQKLLQSFEDFVRRRQRGVTMFLNRVVVFVIVPSIAIAFILYHLLDNPPTGRLQNHGQPINGELINHKGEVVSPTQESASWMLLFIGVRQMITFTLANGTGLIAIDLLTVRLLVTHRLFGSWTALFLMQSRGWPFLLFAWGLWDLMLLSGSKPFFSHWLYFQDAIGLFNASNPAGDVVGSVWNSRVVTIAVVVGLVVSAKRFWFGLTMGRKNYERFSDQVTTLMEKIVLISQVSNLGATFEKIASLEARNLHDTIDHVKVRIESSADTETFEGLLNTLQADESIRKPAGGGGHGGGHDDGGHGGGGGGHGGPGPGRPRPVINSTTKSFRVINPQKRHYITGGLDQNQKDRIVQLLGEWDEPKIKDSAVDLENVSVRAMLQFRRAAAFLRTDYPFSGSFGPATSREEMVERAQVVYDRLLLGCKNDHVLKFETMALIGVGRDGSLDVDKIRELVRLFRPERDGTMRLLDFVKAIDDVYKGRRMLRAAIANNNKIDHSFEAILNIFFYTFLAAIILSSLGFNPLSIFLSISGIILAFAFMIGTASSKYFEGLLFVLIRRPYDIGDGMHISNILLDTNPNGSRWWKVEDVTLFTTTAVCFITGEKATYSNGSLASARIINVSRSQPAVLRVFFKVPTTITPEQLEQFKKEVMKYMKDRPGEWLAFRGVFVGTVDIEKGFMNLATICVHRFSFEKWGPVIKSRAAATQFMWETSKKLGLEYKAPPQPVDLTQWVVRPQADRGIFNEDPLEAILPE